MRTRVRARPAAHFWGWLIGVPLGVILAWHTCLWIGYIEFAMRPRHTVTAKGADVVLVLGFILLVPPYAYLCSRLLTAVLDWADRRMRGVKLK